MSKILVEVSVPVAQTSFDAFLPLELAGYEALALLVKLAPDSTGGLFVADEGTALCRREDGTILDIQLPVWKMGLGNGAKLMLV